nr:hypothetical protein [uncultured Sphingobacterium sp.]
MKSFDNVVLMNEVLALIGAGMINDFKDDKLNVDSFFEKIKNNHNDILYVDDNSNPSAITHVIRTGIPITYHLHNEVIITIEVDKEYMQLKNYIDFVSSKN